MKPLPQCSSIRHEQDKETARECDVRQKWLAVASVRVLVCVVALDMRNSFCLEILSMFLDAAWH